MQDQRPNNPDGQASQSLVGLMDALAAMRRTGGWRALQDVVEALPLAVSAELCCISLKDEGPAGRLHVVGGAGFSPRELARMAYAPLTWVQAEAALDSPADNALSRDLGLRWGSGHRLGGAVELGVLFAGSRTRREPREPELQLLRLAADSLTEVLVDYPRDGRELRRRSVLLARGAGLDRERPAPLGTLRAREVQVLELFGDGLETADIAELLVISPHTVRTHVRNALKTLQVGTRHEAVSMVRKGQIDDVLNGTGLQDGVPRSFAHRGPQSGSQATSTT